ncbi:hypothetical protein D3C84_790210 [compost metagenome]
MLKSSTLFLSNPTSCNALSISDFEEAKSAVLPLDSNFSIHKKTPLLILLFELKYEKACGVCTTGIPVKIPIILPITPPLALWL